MPSTTNKFLSLFVLLMAVIIGIGSLAGFMVFLYSGAFNWLSLGLNEMQVLALNAFLSFAFFIQHSGMVRRGFRSFLAKLIPLCYQGAIYTIVSGLVLFVFLVFWQESGTVLLEAQGWQALFMRGLFFLSVAGTAWGMWALRSVDMFGLDAVIKHQQGRKSVAKLFCVRGPYRWVRHPLYLFTVVIIWSNPLITVDRLLFNVLWTIWIVIGARLEERELVDDFRHDYRSYQAVVPMLLPRSIRPVYPVDSAKTIP